MMASYASHDALERGNTGHGIAHRVATALQSHLQQNLRDVHIDLLRAPSATTRHLLRRISDSDSTTWRRVSRVWRLSRVKPLCAEFPFRQGSWEGTQMTRSVEYVAQGRRAYSLVRQGAVRGFLPAAFPRQTGPRNTRSLFFLVDLMLSFSVAAATLTQRVS